MKKKLVLLLVLTIILISCSWTDNKDQSLSQEKFTCQENLVLASWSGEDLNLKANVISNDVKDILSNNGWNIEYLNCEKGKKVSAKTLIAKIKPDYSDPNIQNLLNQKNMILSQILNTKGIVSSTQSNFSTQSNSFDIQKANIVSQLKILTDSYSKISTQWDLWIWDIDKQLEMLQIQLETLQTQIDDLNKSKGKLGDSKKADIEKLNLNLANTKTQTKSLVWDVLLQIDEVFGISKKNENKNHQYDIYLSAKNSSLRDQVEQNWSILNGKYQSFDTLSDTDIPSFLQLLSDLTSDSKDAIKNSIASPSFPQTTIDSLYEVFFQYENNIVNTKNWIDNILKSLDTITNTYDTQILALDTQINWAQNSTRSVESTISNLKSNKLGTFTTSVDLQKNQTESQIQTLKTNLSQIASQIEALNSQENIQLNQLNSQLSQLQSSLETININLVDQSIYADISGTVKEKASSLWNKIASNSVLCQILPEKSSLKLQVYSALDLSLPLSIHFEIQGKKYTTLLSTKLPYQDSVTQNYVYETTTDIFLEGKKVNLSNIVSEWKVFDVMTDSNKDMTFNHTISVPLDYVNNTINNSTVKVKTLSWEVITQEVILWEVNSNQVEIKSWLHFWETICK